MTTQLDDTQRELLLSIENNGDLYRRQGQPIQRNLLLKMLRGNYDRTKAKQAFKYLADSGAQDYHKEFGMKGQGPSFGPFNAEDRRKVAARLEEDFYQEVQDGEITAENLGLKIPKTLQKQLNQRLAGLSGKGPKVTQRSLDRGR